uniref:Natriuretic peptides A n=1 Tax=Chinchilla lanigera TaxID=34839 RepID=A0A8C2VPZ6_CHILA
MGSFPTIAVSLLLFLEFQLPGQAQANPVYNVVSNADLVDFKNLLDRLEEKMPLEDEVVLPQVASEPNDEAGAVLSALPEAPSWTGEASPAQRDGGALGRGPWDSSDRSALLKSKLRALLAAPRSLRRSSCFGGRMDRIGAQSSLGCNSFRVRGDGDGDGVRREKIVALLRFEPCQRIPPDYCI